MKWLIKSFGGRKVFWGFVTIIALAIGGVFFDAEQYKVYALYTFATYTTMVAGNVATKNLLKNKLPYNGEYNSDNHED